MAFSEECSAGGGDGHTMCSQVLNCECSCHKPLLGDITNHVCTSCHERAVDPSCEYAPGCPWEGQTCHHCANGVFVHVKR